MNSNVTLVMAIYPTLTSGGTLKVLPKETTDNFMVMFSTLPRLALDTWISTPSLIDICLMDQNFNPQNYPQLATFLFCGEELTHATAAKLKQRFPVAHIYNTYGPTETTVAVTSVEITGDILAKYARLPIGYVKPETTIFVKSHRSKKGELLIAGPTVSKGYLRNQPKTDAAFFNISGVRVYRSGDLGYFDDKLLLQGVAVPKYDQQGKVKQLIGTVVLKQAAGDELTATHRVKRALSKLVMPYMIPQRFKYYLELPLSANGKVDIKALIMAVNAHD
ncbi:D-alanine-activating enzyme DltA [Secundilactobacillus pentosiphilus]|uniref:D-alanine-activating enzyme DltA n=2 Tax=Secundilactobacillus pentosiphilus TaxID=1714682 RepID=A0A1Z5IMM0_9LACO|nr:D-alanine-activating enzyme DltA [Secundilactobacillus pentosiphilus]